MTSNEVDAKVEAWHKGDGEGKSLHAHLGWTWEEYKRWVETGRMPNV